MSEVSQNSRGGLLVRMLGLVLIVALVVFALAVLEGIFKILLVILCVAVAAVLIWRLVSAADRR